MTEENVKITGTFLGREDHGIFTCQLHISGDSWGCAFGGYSLDTYDQKKKDRVGTAYGMDFINSILETLEVSEWEKLPGTYCRVRLEDRKVIEIGHLIKPKWFNPKLLSKEGT